MEPTSPPPYLGDYPHGAYWSAVAPEGVPVSDEVEDYTVAGSRLRVMWDEGAGPLWAEDGLLPDDPKWLRRALGLSDSLVSDLLAWLDDRGRQLAERLQGEVGTRYTVRYHA